VSVAAAAAAAAAATAPLAPAAAAPATPAAALAAAAQLHQLESQLLMGKLLQQQPPAPRGQQQLHQLLQPASNQHKRSQHAHALSGRNNDTTLYTFAVTSAAQVTAC
jgi:hypothetical protein